MAIYAQTGCTLSTIVDVEAVYTYYYLASSTITTDEAPKDNVNQPGASTITVVSGGQNYVWQLTEPTLNIIDDVIQTAVGQLYVIECTLFSNGTYDWGPLMTSSTYAAAKAAYNLSSQALAQAQAANDATALLGGHFIYNSTWETTNTPHSANVVQTILKNGIDVTQTPNQWDYNVHIGANGIRLRNNEIILSEWKSNGLKFYKPTTNNTQGNLTMSLTSSALSFYGSSTSTADATLNSNGLKLVKGGIEAGTYSSSSTNFIYLSTDDYSGSPAITINGNSSGWRQIIGSKFGVKNDGTLYANNAIISGQITVGSGSNVYTTDDVNPLEIGGRNLLRHTESPTADDLVLLRGTIEDGGIIRTTPTTSAGAAKFKVTYLDYKDYNGKTLTVSADARLAPVTSDYTISTGKLYIGVNPISRLDNTFSSSYDRYTVKGFTFTSDWQRVSLTLKIPDGLITGKTAALVDGSQITVEVLADASGKPIDWKNIKLEVGNKATDWTPAPEDVQAEIDAKKSVHTIRATGVDASYTYAQLLTYSATTTTLTWNLESVSNIKVGDTVRVGIAVSNMDDALAYILCEVTAVDSTNSRITGYSHGLDTTIIDGGNIITNSIGANQIAANSITASKMVLADYNNYITATENDASTLVGENSEIVNGWIYKNNTGANTWLSPVLNQWTTAGEKYRITGLVKTDVAGKVRLIIYGRTEGGTSNGSVNTAYVTTTANTEIPFNEIITVSSAVANNPKVNIGIQFRDSSDNYIVGYCKQMKCERMSGASLIVDGSITADHLAVNSIVVGKMNSDTQSQVLNSNIEVGGRNILVGTYASVSKATTATTSYVTQNLYYTPDKKMLSELGYKTDDEVTLSFDWAIANATTYGNARIEWYGYKNDSSTDTYIAPLINPFATFSASNTSGRVETTVKLTSETVKAKRILLRIDNSSLTLTISNVKLEKGNKATDWTPAPEDVTAYTDNAVNNIEVGGRNYIRNTGTFDEWTNCGNGTAGTFNDDGTYTFPSISADGWTEIRPNNNVSYAYVKDCKVVLSAEVKGTNGQTISVMLNPYLSASATGDRTKYRNVYLAVDGGGVSQKTVAADGTWQKVYAIVTINDAFFSSGSGSGDYFGLRAARLNTNHNAYSIRKIKLEKGNKATDWSPAPEDMMSDSTFIAYRGTSSTGTSTAAKVVTCKGFVLKLGATVSVYFTSSNTYAGTLTLNVNDTGAKNVYIGSEITSDTNRLLWHYGTTITFTYTDEKWSVVDAPGAFYGTTCSTAAGTAPKATTIPSSAIFKGCTIEVPMTYANTASSPELSINNSANNASNLKGSILYGTSFTAPMQSNGYSWLADMSVIFKYDGKYWRTGNQTIIDGGNILTGTIAADRIKANVISAVNGGTGTINGDKINAGQINIGSLAGDIGGRNLLRGTASPVSANLVRSRSTIQSGGIIRCTPTTSSAYAKFKVDYLDYADYAGKTLTVSADVRLAPVTSEYTTSTARLYIGVQPASRTTSGLSSTYDRFLFKTFTLTSDWQRVSMTVKIPDGLTTGITDILVAGSQIVVEVYSAGSAKPSEWRHIKLEIGNKTTDWEAAQEDYITDIDGAGIRIHPASTENNSVHIDADGVYILKDGTDKTTNSVAFYGDTARIGKSAKGNVLIDEDSIDIRDGSDVLATFGATGATIGESNTRHIEIKDGGLQVYQDSTTVMGHFGYGLGNSINGTAVAPYYSLGVRESESAVGNYSVAEGHSTIASGYTSHAEGAATLASALYSHAEGVGSTTSYPSGTVLGSAKLTASGEGAHAEGVGTKATKRGAHAEGIYTEANGNASHASGYGTIANRANQTVIGAFNVADTTSLFIVGKGTISNIGEISRENAFTVDFNGNVSVNGTTVHSSDRRLKEHISYLGDESIEFINGLKPAHYIKNGEKHVGFYAQDVAEVDRWGCMIGEEMNGYMTLGYTELLAPMVTYIQKLEKRIEQLEEEK